MARSRLVCGSLLLAAALLATATTASAIEVTYGEDYVERPNTRGDDDFINLGYGIDPIPAKSPAVRFNDWRGFRAKVRAEKFYRRQAAQPQIVQPQIVQPQPAGEQIPPGTPANPSAGAKTDAARRPAPLRPTSRRVNQAQQTPRTF